MSGAAPGALMQFVTGLRAIGLAPHTGLWEVAAPGALAGRKLTIDTREETTLR